MEYNFIISVFIISALLPINLLIWALLKILKVYWHRLRKEWDNLFPWQQSVLIVVGSIILAITSTSIYQVIYYFSVEPADPKHVNEEALSNIYQSKVLFVFAIFGACLAVWARAVSQKQLEKSIQINRNDRFAKAVEMLDNIKNKVSSVGGLYMLRDLINENPEAEYIRCVEIISYWILEHKKKRADRYLLNIIAKILKIRSDHKELENIIEKYKTDNNLAYWPFLDAVKLSDAFLLDANFQGASLDEANLRSANLINANLQDASMDYAKLQKANLENANLKNASLEDADLQKANLEDANLQKASLKNANLQKANLKNANLQKANLEDVNLQKADLQTANLQGAILWRAKMQDVFLWKAKLQNADLRGVILDGADFEDAKLRGADLSDAKIRSAIDLTKEQILSAKWSIGDYDGKPPKLPPELSKQPKVQEWLSKDADGNIIKAKKATAKKAIAKKVKAKAKKAKANKPKN